MAKDDLLSPDFPFDKIDAIETRELPFEASSVFDEWGWYPFLYEGPFTALRFGFLVGWDYAWDFGFDLNWDFNFQGFPRTPPQHFWVTELTPNEPGEDATIPEMQQGLFNEESCDLDQAPRGLEGNMTQEEIQNCMNWQITPAQGTCRALDFAFAEWTLRVKAADAIPCSCFGISYSACCVSKTNTAGDVNWSWTCGTAFLDMEVRVEYGSFPGFGGCAGFNQISFNASFCFTNKFTGITICPVDLVCNEFETFGGPPTGCCGIDYYIPWPSLLSALAIAAGGATGACGDGSCPWAIPPIGTLEGRYGRAGTYPLTSETFFDRSEWPVGGTT